MPKTFLEIQFRSHKKHNPDFNIIEGRLDKDTIICYTRRVKFDTSKGEAEQPIEMLEVYRGGNYVIGSTKSNYSRVYTKQEEYPQKYLDAWLELKSLYIKYALLD